jgi:hypothetical protein
VKAFLHIGTEKTGTTTIQHFLATNRQSLLKDGFLYPQSPEDNLAHTKLAAFAMEADKFEDIQKFFKLDNPEKIFQFRNNFQNTLADELEKTSAKTIIFSDEHCSSRLVAKEEIERLKKLLETFFKEIKVIIYLRRQDRFLLSTYSTSIICGKTKFFELPSEEMIKKRYDYWNILQKWESVFGKENIIVRLFEREQLFEGDLLSDFTKTLKIELKKYKKVKNLNESLDADSLDFLRLINHFVPRFINNDINQNRINIISSLRIYSKYYGDKKSLSMPKEMLESFMLNFEESNEQVANYFLNRSNGKLFINDFQNEGGSFVKKITIAKILEITAYLLKDRMKKTYQLWKLKDI